MSDDKRPARADLRGRARSPTSGSPVPQGGLVICFEPSSPWLTMEEAAASLLVSRKVLMRWLNRQARKKPNIICGQNGCRLVRKERLRSMVLEHGGPKP